MAVKLSQKKRQLIVIMGNNPVYVIDSNYLIRHNQNNIITMFRYSSASYINESRYLFKPDERTRYKLYENFIPLPVMEAATESDVFEKIKEALPNINPRCIFITEDGKVLYTEKENNSFSSARLHELKISE